MTTKRSTRSQGERPEEDLKNILITISGKLDNIHGCLKQIEKNQHTSCQTNAETTKTVTTSIEKLQKTFTQVAKTTDAAAMKSEVSSKRKIIAQTWKRHMNKRKQLYWHYHNCENTSIVYSSWLAKEKKVIPKKFLLKPIKNESAEEHNIRRNSVIDKFTAEIQLLKVRSERHEAKYRKVDEDMTSFLEGKFSDNIATELIYLWHEECKEEERKALEKWDSKQMWLEKYEESFDNEDCIKRREEKTRESQNNRHQLQHNTDHHSSNSSAARHTRHGTQRENRNASHQQSNRSDPKPRHQRHRGVQNSTSPNSIPRQHSTHNQNNTTSQRNTNSTTAPRHLIRQEQQLPFQTTPALYSDAVRLNMNCVPLQNQPTLQPPPQTNFLWQNYRPPKETSIVPSVTCAGICSRKSKPSRT